MIHIYFLYFNCMYNFMLNYEFECSVFTCNKVFLHCCFAIFTPVKCQSTSSTNASVQMYCTDSDLWICAYTYWVDYPGKMKSSLLPPYLPIHLTQLQLWQDVGPQEADELNIKPLILSQHQIPNDVWRTMLTSCGGIKVLSVLPCIMT